MFLNLAQLYRTWPDGEHTVLTLPAIQLARWLDEVWGEGVIPGSLNSADTLRTIGGPRLLLRHPQTGGGAARGIAPSGLNPALGPPPQYDDARGPVERFDGAGGRIPLFWDHLILSYLLEATGAFDVVAEVGRRLVAGESLGRLTPPSVAWLRNTEELFFRDPPLFSVSGIVSDWRPSGPAGRRNAYWRMFGMDLPHQAPAGWPQSVPPDAWKQHANPGVNADFSAKMTEFLRQVWLGLENARNSAGANASDANYIALLAQTLGDMMRDRRQGGLLTREEFTYACLFNWIALTLQGNVGGAEIDAPIVRDLQARGAAPEQRLSAIAQKVGMKSAPRARELFQLARPMSQLLRQIENHDYDNDANAETLFRPPSALTADMNRIINLWQSATGQRIKDRPVGTGPGTAQPLRAPAPLASSRPAPQPSANGGSAGN